MNTILWILQILAAIVFTFSGVVKFTQSREKIISIGQTGVKGLPYPLIRFIGFTELLGSLGIILPWALNVSPIFTPLAAGGFGVIMLLAIVVHLRLGEPKTAFGNLLVFLVCSFIAVMRYKELIN